MAFIPNTQPWVPTAYLFRLCVTRQAPYPTNWRDTITMFDNLDEAIAEAMKPQGGAVLFVTVDEAINPATWSTNGRWKRHFKRRSLAKAKAAR